MTEQINGIPVSEIVEKGMAWSNKKQALKLPGKKRVLIGVAKRDGMSCCYCEKHLEFAWMGDYHPNDVATYEHFIRLKKDGGSITIKNGKIACKPCNENRADQDLEVFLEKMAEGYYVEDEVLFRRAANRARRNALRSTSYMIRYKRLKRKERLAYIMKVAYNILNPAVVTAALR